MYIPVENNTNLVRDSESNAVLSVDQVGLKAYKQRKKHNQKIDNLEEKYEHMDERLMRIESVLLSLVSKLDKA